MPEISPIGRTLKTKPAYVGELPPTTSPETIRALYEFEATRINRWINVSFGGLVTTIEEKEGLLATYETELTDWHRETVDRIKKQDADIADIKTSETKFFGIKIK